MRQLNLVSGAVLWCVHFDEISSSFSVEIKEIISVQFMDAQK
jgi:hypothetical protein